MKWIAIITSLFFAVSCAKSTNSISHRGGEEALPSLQTSTSSIDESEMETDEHVLSPEQEQEFLLHIPSQEKARSFKFPQTTWNECKDALITGNYTGAGCSSSRNIAVILQNFMNSHMYKCVDAGLAAQGGGKTADLHITHAGIFADPRHSPRSMHAENRAVDVKSFEVQLTNGQAKKFVYEGKTNRAFYTAFRKCWGDVVHNFNGCPYYKSSSLLTGSIGWENANHQHHMHTSVPYCTGGNYGAFYFKK